VSKNFLLIALMVVLVFAVSGSVFAQEDDDASPADDDASPVADDDTSPVADDDDGSPNWGVEGTADSNNPPVELQPTTAYNFAFDVFNNGGVQAAIKKVKFELPAGYGLKDSDVQVPAALHPSDGHWTKIVEELSATITWEFQGTESSVFLGDIKENDIQPFQFLATTDATGADGFKWTLTGDDGAGVGASDPYDDASVSSGIFFFGQASDDDMSPPADDDDDVDHHDASSGSSGGCGC